MATKAALALDIVQFGLDIAGIADPTGVVDGISGLISLGRGQLLDAAISAVSILPYLGDAAKAAKIPKYARSIAEAIQLAAKDAEFATQLKPAFQKLLAALDEVPVSKLPGGAQAEIVRMRSEIQDFLRRRIYNPNPKHELAGAMGRKGTRLDLSPDDAARLLNDPARCFDVPGKKQLVAVQNGKIYVFQPDGTGAFHAYPVSGQEIAANYPSVAARVAGMLGINVKRLSRME